jgi:hypothetical protein
VTRIEIAVLAVSFAPLLTGGYTGETDPAAERIIDATIERAEQVDDPFRTRWNQLRYRFTSVTEKLDDDDEIENREERVFDVYPIEDTPYFRPVSVNGRPLTKAELDAEEERERKFRIEAAKKASQDHDTDDEEEGRLVLDGTVKDRFVFEYVGEEALDGRRTFLLRFEPSDKKVPSHNRLEAAVNKTGGTVWIDADTFEVHKIHFALRDEVKIWGGLLGSISKAEGTFERQPLENEDLWVPQQLELSIDGRKLFESLHRRQLMEWSEYREERSSP